MPNPKLGTVTNNIKSIVKALNLVKLKLKMIKMVILQLQLVKKSFADNKIKENYNLFLETILKEKPIWYKG